MTDEPTNRRPLATRGARWAQGLARALADLGVQPNHISVASLVFAAGSGAALVASAGPEGGSCPVMLLVAAACIQLRLLCNLLDGMVAVEGGRKSKSGEVFNDFPDRLADSMTLVGLGYALPTVPHAMELGWLAGLLAVLTAYTRVLGAACGTGHYFVGPLAKQHRMALTTGALVLAALGTPWQLQERVLYGALVILCVGSALTTARRLRNIVRDLESR